MSNPNTIPEFLGIIAGTIIVMTIVGVAIGTAHDEVKKKLKKNPDVIPSPKKDTMFKSLKKIQEYTKLGQSMNSVSQMLTMLLNKHKGGHNSMDLKEEIYIISYVARKGILDRMDEYEWNLEGPILVPVINSKNITLFHAYNNTISLIKSLSIELGFAPEVESILKKETCYYEFERLFPAETIKQLDKLILID
jgi:hypothetical protein